MKLIVILLSLAIEHVFGPLENMRRWLWFRRFVAWLGEKLRDPAWDGWPLVIIAIGLPLLAAWIVLGQLWALGSLVALLLSLAVVLYCLGPRDLHREVEAWLQAARTGDEIRRTAVEVDLAARAAEPDADSPPTVAEAVLVLANERLFAVFFWFVVLGPIGALLLRIASELRFATLGTSHRRAESAAALYAILAWIPARLLALGYALSGSLVHAFEAWRFDSTLSPMDNERVLRRAGWGALGIPAILPAGTDIGVVEAAVALVRRAFLIWLTVLAIATLGGWLG